MKKIKWVAYGLDMPLDYVIVETEGETVKESHNKAVELFQENKVDFDTVEMVTVDFLKRTGFLKESLNDLLSKINDSNRHEEIDFGIEGRELI